MEPRVRPETPATNRGLLHSSLHTDMTFATLDQPRELDGRFAAKTGTAPEAELSELFWVEDTGGDGSDLRGGERTEEAEWLFRNGQCLALASELAEALGSNRVIVVTDEYESEDAVWDEETNSPVLDEDGQVVMETTISIHHAYALSADGRPHTTSTAPSSAPGFWKASGGPRSCP